MFCLYNFRKVSSYALILIIQLFSFYSWSQNNPIEPIEPPEDWEKWQENVPSSTSKSIVGIQFLQTDEIDNPSFFYAIIPKNTPGYLTATIKSKDGRYIAKLNYNLSSLKQKVYSFKVPTKYESELRNYTKKEVTILCEFTDTLNDSISFYTIAGWSNPLNDSIVIINILHSRKAKLKIELDDTTNIILFNKLEQPYVYFNQECLVKYNKLTNSKSVILSVEKRIGPKIKTEASVIPILKEN